ncbi:MAG TPA: phosphate signaling complex protein PhoU [Candidatus Dormibacteraeota bacterium]|nr:phosphate signaling complex protein PhoU [Candidatus Dormibacteraeota bacterium]
MTREAFRRELETLRESLLRMAGLVESQIDDALTALRTFDRAGADLVRRNDQSINELFRQLREQVFQVIATQQPVARDLRTLMGVQFVAIELERMGDYAVRIARRTSTLAGLPHGPLRPELGLMGELASQQVRDILDALIEEDAARAREVAAKDDEIDRLYNRLFDSLVDDMGGDGLDAEDALRTVTLINVAHNLERIGDRVVNVAEDIIFLESGFVVELD